MEHIKDYEIFIREIIKETVRKELEESGLLFQSSESMLTEKQTAHLLQVKPQTLATWRTKGIGPNYIKLGSSIRYKRQSLLEYIANNQVVTSN
jgi:predicted DNA-binding transcriptional regulator AlpA